MVIKCRLIPKGICINLFGTFWARNTSWIDKYVINHERIHTAQMRELLFVPFYILYVTEWIVRLIQYRNRHKAYMNISFEREAYANDRNLTYLKSRPPFSWRRYIRNNKMQ